MPNESTSNATLMDDVKKFWLAIAVLALCLIGLTASALLFYNANSEPKIEAAKSIFNSVLPLLGAWVGAILAYYFGAKQVEVTQTQQARALDLIQRQVEESSAIVQNAQTMMHSQLQKMAPIKKE
jgi:2C-methyl-D-erythritol 2,4-cyclodiphosphate synthase